MLLTEVIKTPAQRLGNANRSLYSTLFVWHARSDMPRAM
jgi:hypothetical protein